jgi:haloacid dehalogenase-like hydrolase
LLDSESYRQLESARQALAQIPGVFLDDRYQHSIRAYTFEGKTAVLSRGPITSIVRAILSASADDVIPVPLPTLSVRQLLADNGLDRLCAHQTTLDTTILARDVDKGRGLMALLDWVGLADADVTAVGDSEPDLAMFRVARRSFAPANMSCAREARLLGCRIVNEPYQRGLLSSVRALVHPSGKACPRCSAARVTWPHGQDFFLDLLTAADRQPLDAFLRALFDSRAYQLFLR